MPRPAQQSRPAAQTAGINHSGNCGDSCRHSITTKPPNGKSQNPFCSKDKLHIMTQNKGAACYMRTLRRLIGRSCWEAHLPAVVLDDDGQWDAGVGSSQIGHPSQEALTGTHRLWTYLHCSQATCHTSACIAVATILLYRPFVRQRLALENLQVKRPRRPSQQE